MLTAFKSVKPSCRTHGQKTGVQRPSPWTRQVRDFLCPVESSEILSHPPGRKCRPLPILYSPLSCYFTELLKSPLINHSLVENEWMPLPRVQPSIVVDAVGLFPAALYFMSSLFRSSVYLPRASFSDNKAFTTKHILHVYGIQWSSVTCSLKLLCIYSSNCLKASELEWQFSHFSVLCLTWRCKCQCWLAYLLTYRTMP